MPPIIRCRGLRKTFGAVTAVDGFDLDVVEGELLALLGPSGCGKTTFLRLLAGFERPDAGTITVAGRLVAANGTFVPPERRRVGVVLQDYALFPHLTVAGNVGYGLSRAERRGGAAAKRRGRWANEGAAAKRRGRWADEGSRARSVLELVGLSGLAERYPHELSGGQQQRVALARALAPQPPIVLLDEPFSNLDAALRDRVRSEVRDILLAAGATAIVVTHDQEEALSLAHRVAVMRAGTLHQVDTPDRLYTRPADAFVASFVGGANLIEASSDGQAVASPLGTVHVADAPPAGRALLVVRPESVRLRADGGGAATVSRSTFYGHDQIVELRMDDGTVLRSRVGPGRFFEPGDRVAVTVVEDEALAFPAAY